MQHFWKRHHKEDIAWEEIFDHDSDFMDAVFSSMREIESHYDVKDERRFMLAMEGTSSIEHIYALLRYIERGEGLAMLHTQPVHIAHLLHYSGNLPATKQLVGEYGGYFRDMLKQPDIDGSVVFSHISPAAHYSQ